MATTVLIGFSGMVALVGVDTEPVPAEPVFDIGDSDSLLLAEVEVIVFACAIEFFLLATFFDRDVLTGAVAPLPRLRFLITSVFRLSGRTTP
jgi:hypothetical protein